MEYKKNILINEKKLQKKENTTLRVQIFTLLVPNLLKLKGSYVKVYIQLLTNSVFD